MNNKKYHYTCIVEECNRTRYQHGYCKEHFKQFRRYGKIIKIKLGNPEFVYPTTIINNTVYISVKNNNVVIIDLDNIDLIKHRHIAIYKNGYAYIYKNNTCIPLHRIILNHIDKDDIDHINHNKLDNRKINLRICSRSENMHNTDLRRDNTTGYKGVYKITKSPNKIKYAAQITINKKRICLGNYDSLEKAIMARRVAERIYNPSNL